MGKNIERDIPLSVSIRRAPIRSILLAVGMILIGDVFYQAGQDARPTAVKRAEAEGHKDQEPSFLKTTLEIARLKARAIFTGLSRASSPQPVQPPQEILPPETVINGEIVPNDSINR